MRMLTRDEFSGRVLDHKPAAGYWTVGPKNNSEPVAWRNHVARWVGSTPRHQVNPRHTVYDSDIVTRTVVPNFHVESLKI